MWKEPVGRLDVFPGVKSPAELLRVSPTVVATMGVSGHPLLLNCSNKWSSDPVTKDPSTHPPNFEMSSLLPVLTLLRHREIHSFS